MTNVAIVGAAGRMGRTLIAGLEARGELTLAAAIDRPGISFIGADSGELAGIGTNGVPVTDDLEAACDKFDVLVDFTIASAVAGNVDICRRHGKKMVIGTTGLDEAQKQVIADAGKEIAIVFAPNYSIGVNMTFKLAEIAAGILGDDVDIEIIEAHHRHKVDAPSGTALRLGEAVAGALGRDLDEVAIYGRQGITGERDRKAIGFHSIRAGEIIGDHTVMFTSAGETLEIRHHSQSRTHFAAGALRAAAWVGEKTAGVFDMKDVLGLA